jgi:hypothetical protein
VALILDVQSLGLVRGRPGTLLAGKDITRSLTGKRLVRLVSRTDPGAEMLSLFVRQVQKLSTEHKVSFHDRNATRFPDLTTVADVDDGLI